HHKSDIEARRRWTTRCPPASFASVPESSSPREGAPGMGYIPRRQRLRHARPHGAPPQMSIVELEEHATENARGKVVEGEGGGGDAVHRMIEEHLERVVFSSVNTDAQAHLNSMSDVKVQIDKKVTRGLGAGARPEIGLQANEEN